MRLRSQSWLNLLIGLLLGLVVVNGGIAYHNLRKIHQNAQQVARSQATLESLESTLSTLVDAETGQRGYLLTRERVYLRPYEDAVAREEEEVAALAALVVDSPDLAQRMPELRETVDAKLAELDRTVKLALTGDFEAAQALVRSNQSLRTMARLRRLVGDMQQAERSDLAQREEADARAYRSAVVGILLSSVAGIAALVAVLMLLQRHLRSILDASDELHRQRELLKATLVSIGDGVIVTDIVGRVTLLNSVAERLTAWSQDEAEGQDLDTVFRIVHESTREPVENPSLRVLRDGKIVGLANHTILIARDGSEYPIDDSAAPITTSKGHVSGAVLVFRDITQRKQHEQALVEHTTAVQSTNARLTELLAELKASEELFHSMADSIPQLAWMTRPDGHIYWYNRRWYDYTGSTPEQMEGWGWQDVHDPAELDRVTESWKAALASGQPWEDTFPLRRHDGVMRWHLSRAVPLRNERGEIVRWFGTNTDITERLDMEQALREADHRKDEFLATLAHELRNPITPISNALQVWPHVEHDPQEVEKLRAIMERQVRQMTRLIDDLLDVSRITRGKIQLRCQPVDLNTIIAGAVEGVSPLMESAGHELEVVEAPRPLMVDGDVARLTQAVGNLLHNAAKYTPRQGRIRIALSQNEQYAEIRVSDNGVGIPEPMLDRIFDMFQQVDQTLDRSHGGLGLGLTLVKRLVELHGGEVAAHSAGEGQGSEFLVRLPILETADDKPVPTSPDRRTVDLPRHRVLVVDDVYASAKTLAMMLESINQQVEIAHDGPTAIEQVAALRPDVVFLDIAMPGMNGYEVARALRAKNELERVRLVALTGYGNEEDRRKAMEAGFHYHLTKPASIDQLTQVLDGLPQAEADSPA